MFVTLLTLVKCHVCAANCDHSIVKRVAFQLAILMLADTLTADVSKQS